MANRLVKWVLYTIIFAFIPISVSLLLTYLIGAEKNISDFNNEVLFFTIMICSTSLSDIVTLNKKIKDFLLTIFSAFFILLVLFSTVMYGSMIYGDINDLLADVFKERVFYISVILAFIASILGTIIQILLSRTEVDL